MTKKRADRLWKSMLQRMWRVQADTTVPPEIRGACRDVIKIAATDLTLHAPMERQGNDFT